MPNLPLNLQGVRREDADNRKVMENYKSTVPKPPMADDEFAAIWRSVHLKVTDTYDTPPEILWGEWLDPLGHWVIFSASTGKAKSKKAPLISRLSWLQHYETVRYYNTRRICHRRNARFSMLILSKASTIAIRCSNA